MNVLNGCLVQTAVPSREPAREFDYYQEYTDLGLAAGYARQQLAERKHPVEIAQAVRVVLPQSEAPFNLTAIRLTFASVLVADESDSSGSS